MTTATVTTSVHRMLRTSSLFSSYSNCSRYGTSGLQSRATSLHTLHCWRFGRIRCESQSNAAGEVVGKRMLSNHGGSKEGSLNGRVLGETGACKLNPSKVRRRIRPTSLRFKSSTKREDVFNAASKARAQRVGGVPTSGIEPASASSNRPRRIRIRNSSSVLASVRSVDYSIPPPIVDSPPPPPARWSVATFLVPLSMLAFFGMSAYIYFNPEKEVFEYWEAVQSGRPLPSSVFEDDDDFEEDEDEDEDEETIIDEEV